MNWIMWFLRKSLHDVIDFNQTDLTFRRTHERSGSRPTFLQINLNIGTLRLLMDPAMDGIGELEALPQEEMVEVLEVIGYEKRTIGE